jgi:polyisoprenyl-phosphate glycosyltransferase
MNQEKLEISIVSPVFGAPDLIPELCRRIHNSVSSITNRYEIILVFDCSPDDGWSKIKAECKKDLRVKGIKLSRNFGQHKAIAAGLHHAQGDKIVVMDCDLQDMPEEIPVLYKKIQEGYDIVKCRREIRKDSFLRKLLSKCFFKFFSFISGVETDHTVVNFGIYNKKVIDVMRQLKEQAQYFPLSIIWSGFKSISINVTHDARRSGKSGYTFSKMISLATDIAVSYSEKPLYVSILLGGIISLTTIVISVIYFLLALLGYFDVSGFASIIISIWLLSGVLLFFIGLVGLYIAGISANVKRRPLFIIEKTSNIRD